MPTVTLSIPVTAKHIADGKCRQCPVALAIQERTNLLAYVSHCGYVNLRYADLRDAFCIKFPPIARRWIWKFDRFGHAEPFTFPLTLPVVETV